MVEVFCGILAGAAVGPDIRKWMAGDREANLVSMAFNCSGLALSFLSSVANCYKPIANLLTCGSILSATESFTHSIKGKSSVLSHNSVTGYSPYRNVS